MGPARDDDDVTLSNHIFLGLPLVSHLLRSSSARWLIAMCLYIQGLPDEELERLGKKIAFGETDEKSTSDIRLSALAELIGEDSSRPTTSESLIEYQYSTPTNSSIGLL